MRSFVLLSKPINSLEILHIEEMLFEKCRLYIGILEQPDIIFDRNSNANDENILIRTKAFSCNYRDKAVLLSIIEKFKIAEQEANDILLYSYFGSDFVGEVVEIGSQVTKFKQGDRVIPNDSFPYVDSNNVTPGIATNFSSCEFQVFNQAKLLTIPTEMPDEVAAGFSITAHTVFGIIRRLNIDPNTNSNVLVLGGKSNTSIAVISLLRSFYENLKIVAVTRSENNKKMLIKIGANEVILNMSSKENLLISMNDFEKLMHHYGGFDIVIDPFLDIHFENSITLMKHYSQYITFGWAKQSNLNKPDTINKTLSELFFPLLMKNITVHFQNLGVKKDIEDGLFEYIRGKYCVYIDSIYRENNLSGFLERTFFDSDKFGKVIYKY